MSHVWQKGFCIALKFIAQIHPPMPGCCASILASVLHACPLMFADICVSENTQTIIFYVSMFEAQLQMVSCLER